MLKYFETGVRYDKTLENGVIKPVTELYIVNAVSFTECEKIITEAMQPYLSGDFEVVKESITRISEIVDQEDATADRYYLVKYNFITIDERTAKEKKTAVLHLVHASDFDDAKKRAVKHMSDTMADWEIDCIKETKYIDVY